MPRPQGRVSQSARESEVSSEQDYDFPEEEDEQDTMPVTPAESRPRGVPVRMRTSNTETYSDEPEYGKITPPPRALRGSGTPLTPAPIRLYVRVAAFVLLSLAVIGFFVMNAYSSVVITIVPKVLVADVDALVSASIDGTGLRFSTLDHQLEAKAIVAATGVSDVSELASGYITIYNAFSEGKYALKKNTRFETSDKKIFRIQESTEIPGYTKKDGVVTPGSVVARVYSDTPGVDGNIDAARFTIPGLAGGAEFEKMYAESTSTFTGGLVGKQSIVSDEERAKAVDSLKQALDEKLRSYATEQRPAGEVLYLDAVRIKYTELPAEPMADDSKATITVRAELSVPMFAIDDLSNEVAKHVLPEYAGQHYKMQKPEALSFAYAEGIDSSGDNIAFTLAGKTSLVEQINQSALQADLAGLQKSDITTITAKYPMIERISYKLSPAWKQSFPDDAARITFDIVTPE